MKASYLKRALLTAVFEAYDEIARRFSFACTRECSACCTNRVIVTSAEAALVLDYVEEKGRTSVLDKALAEMSSPPPRPALSINALAEYCLRKHEPPETETGFAMTPCPLRDRGGCPVYEARPFACRSMWSEEVCKHDGEALMDPLLITVGGVFQQIIEHLDCGGLYGNFMDMLSLMVSKEHILAYKAGIPLEPTNALVEARPNPGFVAPPEHRQHVGKYVGTLWQREVEGMPFKVALDLVRKPGFSGQSFQ